MSRWEKLFYTAHNKLSLEEVNVKKKLSIVLAVILTVTLLLTSLTFAGGGKEEVVPAQMVLDASLSEVSTVFDTPKANLEVATSREFNFEADTFLLSSIVDKNSKQAYMVSTDAQRKVWIAKPKIEGELIDYMSQMKPDETVAVSIWAIYVSPEEELQQIPSKYPDITFEGYYPALGADVSPEVLDAIEADVREIKLRAHEEAVQPVVDFLQSTGSKIIYVSRYAPTVDAELSKEDIYKLARLPEVKRISRPGEFETYMDTAAETIEADRVWDEGFDGGGRDGTFGESEWWPYYYQTAVAVIDKGIDFSHPCLEHADGGTYQDKPPALDHGTQVAGCIAGIHDTFKGIAYGTKLLDANFAGLWSFLEWVYIKRVTEWAHDNYVDLYNFSAGIKSGTLPDGHWDNDYCEYFDHIASEWNRLPVCAAGNDAGYVTPPANAWNVLAVGGIDNKNTEDWADDTIAYFSSWENPETPHGDREKPEVCAPAVDITTTDRGEGEALMTDSGTSYAAPQVAGLAALLIEQYWHLTWRPELLKAIIMASAIHNVEPDDDYEQWCYGYPYVEQYRPMDDKEGVGTVNAKAAYDCVANNWIWSDEKEEDDLPFAIQFSAEEGQTVRFVITWHAHTTYEGWTDYELCADLNLEIKGGPYYPWWKTWYGGSNSYDSAWEIFQFTAPYTGNYYAWISAYNRGAGDPWTYNGPEDIAAAWYCW